MEIMLGNVPKHWPVKRLGQLFRERKEKVNDRDFPPLSVTKLGILPQLETAAKSDDGDNRKGVHIGDFVINSRSDRKGSGGLSELKGSISLINIVLEPKNIFPRFAHHLLRCSAFQEEFYRWGHGIVADLWTTRFSEMKNIRLAIPDIETQRSISTYLDSETTHIDKQIEKKTHFIVLLKEKRSAVISNAVTKGIDREVSFRDSGQDWLGKVPAHWKIVPPTLLFTESKERAFEEDQLLSATQKYGVIPLKEFEELEQRRVTLALTNLEKRKHVEIGDFVISMRSMDGGLERARAIGSVRSSYSVLKPSSNVEGRYYGALLKSSLYIQALRLTSNFIREGQDMNFSHFRKVRLPKLPVEEQIAIADHIEAETTRIDSLISLTERSIDRLREYRAALITAAVTGQIDLSAHAVKIQSVPDRTALRTLVGAEIVHRHRNIRKFGRVKFQKELYLAEAYVGISELEGSYLRKAAGPHDQQLMGDVEGGMAAQGYYRTDQPDGNGRPVSYVPLDKAGQHEGDLKSALGSRADKLSAMIDLLRDFDTNAVEAIATLYAVWNDLLAEGEAPDDDTIIHHALTEWHPEKSEKFRTDDLAHWLGWMKRHDFMPTGTGPITTTGRLFV